MKQTRAILAILLVALAILVWSPWLTAESARQRTEAAFTADWYQVADGCGLACTNCGAHEVRRALVGYFVTLEYACGMIPADEPQYHTWTEAYVSPFGTVHGLPAP